MHQIAKRGLALLMALIMCIGLLPVMNLRADAAEIEYVYDSTNKYIYNWGSRGETATSLSPKAEEFYTNTTYTELSQLSGGTSTSDAPDSALYSALQKLMKDAHSNVTSYDATRDLYQYTDCQNSGKDSKAISSFYSGDSIGPAWDGGSTWNREHTWPNSKGLGGQDENDIMMLRPTASSENGPRGNKAYGESTGYYFPNTESNGKYDVRGDVARIFLYVYVRWGNVNGNGQYTTWGSQGVMESLDVLLKWMEEDPVDTWELGRNDSVEAITGTRNVFVDYPELAFLLFGADMPANMPTPSGEASNKCDHNNFDAGVVTAPTCTAKGYTTYTCQTAGCGYSYKANIVPAIGHSYEDGKCKTCGEAEPATPVEPTYVTEIATNTAYKLGLYSTNKNATYYFLGTMSGYYGATDTAYDKGVDMFVEETAGGYYLYFINSSNTKQYINLVQSGTYYNFTYGTTAASVFSWDTDKDALYTTVGSETCYMGTYGTYVTMGVLRDSKLQTTDYIARMYTMDSGETPCEHLNTETLPGKDATCGEPGLTEGKKCTDCGATLTAQQEIPATGEHTYVGGVCTGCGKEEPTGTEATITFDDKSKRTEYSTTIQVWEENGITVTNEKGASTTNVGDYADPARFYQGSSLKIEFPGMTKIVFNCNNYKDTYAGALKDSIGNVSGVTVTVNGTVVTVEFAQAQDSLAIAKMTAQARVDSITVYAAGGETPEPECQHTNTTVEGAVPATCTTDGHTGKTVCVDCGVTTDEGEAIPATGHNYVGGVCTGCGKEESAEPEQPVDGLTPGVGYKITANNADGALWYIGTVTGGRFDGSANEADAVLVYVEVVDGGYLLYQMNGTAKSYINMDDKSAGASLSANAATATVYVWDANLKTLVVADPDNARAFGCQDTSTYSNFSCYAVSNTTGYNWGQYIPAAGETPEPECQHTNTTVEGAVPATCTTDGHTGKTVCVDCRETLDEGEAIPATGHTEEPVPGKDATCTEAGLTDGVKCSVCGVVLKEQEEIPATGHDYEAVVTEPTCNLIGYTTHTCAGCGDSYVTDEVRPTGHLEENREEKPYVAPTQTEAGYTAGVYCNGCGTYLYGHEQIPALGYTVRFIVPATVTAVAPITGTTVVLPTAEAPAGFAFVGWVTETVKDSQKQPEVLHYAGEELTVSADTVLYALYTYDYSTTNGTNSVYTVYATVATNATETTATLSFANKAQRTAFTTSQQVWEQNGIKLINDKSASTSNVADYAGPARFYASSKITIECPGMTKIVFDCNSSSYATALKNSISGATVSVSSDKVTVTFSAAQDSFVITKLSAQVRMDSLTVTITADAGGEECAHTNTTIVGAQKATCTTDGHTGKTVCDDCGATTNAGTVIPATGHNYVGGTCTVCGEPDPSASGNQTAYIKITSLDQLVTGQYVMIVSNGYAPTKYDSSGWVLSGKPTVSGDEVADPDNYIWTLTVDGTSVTIQDAAGTFIKPKAGNNNGIQTGTYKWKIVFANGTFQFQGTGSDTTTLAANVQSSNKFRAYKNTTVSGNPSGYPSQFTLYKLTEIGETPEPECQHTNTTIKDAQKATCTTDGHTGKTVCVECGETLNEGTVIPATGHNYENGFCTGCGEAAPAVYTTVIGNECAHENTHLDGVAAATCTTDGNTGNLVCDACGVIVSKGKAILAQHIWTEATCMNAKICGVCGETDGEPLAHTPGQELIENEVAADCVTDGSYDKVHYCTICGEEASRETVPNPATGHTPSEPAIENEVAPTCTADGSYDKVYYCTICGEEASRETVPVPATGHTPSEPVIEKEFAADCVNDGSYDSVVYCSVCKAEISRETVPVLATGHDYQAVVTAPTCSENGYTTYTCSVCGDSYAADEVPATGNHVFGAWNVLKAATCTEGGMRTRSCVCGASQTEMIAATGVHAYSAWTETKAATCTEEGEKTRSCACGINEFAKIAALGHTEVVDAAVAATCTTAGKTEGKHCDLCNEVLTAQEEIPALGHSEVTDAGKAATCTTAGKTEGKHCSVCGEVLVAQEVIAATGHSFGDWKVSKEATRTEAGEETRSCACGETETREIPALGGVNPVPVVIVVVAGLGAVAVVAFVFMKKKRA